MRITSSAFSDGDLIPMQYTCEGDNINPPLIFEDIPEGAQTLALIMEDPDVPRTLRPDGLFVHWVVWNLPATTTGIGEGEMPEGVEGANTRGDNKYTGPCPPDREHRYFFTLYALDSYLELPDAGSKQELEMAMTGRILETARIMGRYDKQNR